MEYEKYLYAQRDVMSLGVFYSDHVDHMTGEGLHSKSDIAAELAFRDMKISQLAALVDRMNKMFLLGGDFEAKQDSYNPVEAWMHDASEALKGYDCNAKIQVLTE